MSGSGINLRVQIKKKNVRLKLITRIVVPDVPVRVAGAKKSPQSRELRSRDVAAVKSAVIPPQLVGVSCAHFFCHDRRASVDDTRASRPTVLPIKPNASFTREDFIKLSIRHFGYGGKADVGVQGGFEGKNSVTTPRSVPLAHSLSNTRGQTRILSHKIK